MSIDNPVNFHIFSFDFIYNHIVFPYYIFIVCMKVNSFRKISTYTWKHLNVLKSFIYLFYCFSGIIFIIFSNIISNLS